MNEPLPGAGRDPLDPKKLLREAIVGGEASSAAAGWQPPPLDQLDARFPELEVVELIGRGGMGAVYRAVQSKLARTVALKVLPAELAQDPAFEERFLREARALATLEHPRILTVHDFGERDGLFYLVTEFVEGMNLRQLMDMGELSPVEALRLTPQICEALQYAHDHGVVHRDIKPENLLVDTNGELKIADFGLARIVGEPGQAPALTRSTQVLGTPQYMAPEQWRSGASVDHRADIYSVGVVLYEMLTGQLPLGHFDPPSSRQGVPKGLDQVVQRSLAQRPEQRYQRASEVGDDLRRQRVEPPRPARAQPACVGSDVGAPRPVRVAWMLLGLLLVGAIFAGQALMQRNIEYQQHASRYAAQQYGAKGWSRREPTDARGRADLAERYVDQVLVPAWRERRDEALAAGEPFDEPRPTVVAAPGYDPGIAMSWMFVAALGLGSLLFTVLGFVGVSSIVARRRGPSGLGLTVFTAWIVPVVLAAWIPAYVLAENIRDNDTSVIVAGVVALLMGVLGVVLMIWHYRQLAARIADEPEARPAGEVAPGPYGPIAFAWLVLVGVAFTVAGAQRASIGIAGIEALTLGA
ncbi:MAG: protein kinase, partial [Planctomycetes bacterium]|nr:protein kinase [Planctomycetota bacterium]